MSRSLREITFCALAAFAIIGVLVVGRAAAGDGTHCDAQHPHECQLLRERVRGLESERRRLRAAIAWQKHERAKDARIVASLELVVSTHLSTVRQLGPGAGAIIAASYRLHTSPLGWLTQGFCESRLDPNAKNGTHLGLFQMDSGWRASVTKAGFPALDPYGQAFVAIAWQLVHGSGPWQCKTDGSVR